MVHWHTNGWGMPVDELPTGTVTFLFTDLERSTRRWEEDPDAMRRALARHDEALAGVIGLHDGYLVKSTGDGVMAAFAIAAEAVEAAIDGQRAIDQLLVDGDTPLRVRMGLHTGTPEVRGADYFGPTVNRAARLMGVAHGGQVVTSQTTANLAGPALDASVALVDLGEHRLRDLTEPEHVFEVRAPGLRAKFPPLSSMDAFPGNLPLQVSTYVARDQLQQRVTQALTQARVVTLTGVGGVGKTRLALQVAADLQPTFREGAWIVELAPVRDPERVWDAVASVFRLRAAGGPTVEDDVVEFLRTRQLLMVMDNCEHLVDACAEVVEVLERQCPELVVLATSREGLGVDGEQDLVVPTLAGPEDSTDLGLVATSEAVTLLVDRARRVDPDFVVDADNATAIVELCRRLDGMPLAIELAAAQLVMMTPSELVRRLDHRFEVLTQTRRRSEERHQTLRAVIDWSYALCTPTEQRLLARLAVFAGGWSLESAEAVGADDPTAAGEVFPALRSLVAKSLVIAEHGTTGTRYRLLECIREYAEERLAELGETDSRRRVHAEQFVAFEMAAFTDMCGPLQIEAGQRLIAERENLLAAVSFAIDAGDVDLALRVVAAASDWVGSQATEARVPAGLVLDLEGATDHHLYPWCLALAAQQAVQTGDEEQATRLSTEAHAAIGRLGDPGRNAEQVLVSSEAVMAYARGDTHAGADWMYRGSELARDRGDVVNRADALAGAASFHAMHGETATAISLATEAVDIAEEHGLPRSLALATSALAGALTDDDPARARQLLTSPAMDVARDVLQGAMTTQLVIMTAKLGDWPELLERARPAMKLVHWVPTWPLVSVLHTLIARAIADTDPETAARLRGAARTAFLTKLTPGSERRQETSTSDAPPVRRTDIVTIRRRETAAILEEALGRERVRELQSEGAALGRDEAVAYTLGVIDEVSARS
ncbi:MAG TPA: adenylate/guanylate cyclase domain-containing protein [Acidimicrobiales bacterium]